MKNEFKVGEPIFLIDRINYVRLAKFHSSYGSKSVEAVDIETGDSCRGYGFAITPENREALVTLYGEDEVPELPLRGSDLTRKLLEKQKYVLCLVGSHSDECARDWLLGVCIATAVEDDGFTLADGGFAYYAVPIDMNGNEITEIG